MQLTSRRFLIAKDGVLYRLADATFTRMLQNPREHAFAILAGQRVRMASLIVELIGGKPARVVRSTFATLTFDEDGHMDLGTFTRQQWALAESALDPAFVRTKPEKRFSTLPLGSLRKEENGAPRTHWRAPSTRPHSDKFAVVGCSGPVAQLRAAMASPSRRFRRFRETMEGT
jgi:hypothetical protein